MHIIIPGQTRSKKNGKVIRYKWHKGRKVPFLTSSKLYKAWAAKALIWIKKQGYGPWPGDFPIEIKFFLFRADRRKWDWDNVFCGSLDILQQTKIIPDDDALHVMPIPAGWTIDRKNPRVELLLCKPKKIYYREDLYVGSK